MKVSLDTNILIDSPQVVFDKDREFVISFTVIRELDGLKRNPDLKRTAQQALKNIWHLIKDDRIEILNLPDALGQSPDEKIIQDTKDSNASLLTDDIGARLIAKAFGVPISDFEADDNINYDYTGMITIEGDVDYENNFVQIKELPLEEFNMEFKTDLKENQFCIIDRTVEKNDIWINKLGHVKKLSQSSKPLKDSGVMELPLDSEQMCAYLSIIDKDIPLSIVDGSLGCLVSGEQLEVKVEPILVSKKELVDFISSNIDTNKQSITSKLTTLKKHNVINLTDDKYDLTEFGPSLMIYFKLPKSYSYMFINDNKYNDKYLHFRYWLSYFDYDIDKAYNRVKFLRGKRVSKFFKNEINEEFNLDNTVNINNIKHRLLMGENINFKFSGRLNKDYYNGFKTTEAFKKDIK